MLEADETAAKHTKVRRGPKVEHKARVFLGIMQRGKREALLLPAGVRATKNYKRSPKVPNSVWRNWWESTVSRACEDPASVTICTDGHHGYRPTAANKFP